MKYAIVKTETNVVENIIIWDGSTPILDWSVWTPVLLNTGEECNMGYSYDPQNSPRFFASDFNDLIL
jgi:hypothetical protein